ncbi:MAG TPA: hypothetical protein VMT46_08975 [Anaerolineaceae bacterium]|nr:hypothetical protein [Anaerolineaceae bacterium]
MEKKKPFIFLFVLLFTSLACGIPIPNTGSSQPTHTSQPGKAGFITRELDTVRKGSSDFNLADLVGKNPLSDGDVVQIIQGGEAVLEFGSELQMRMFNDTRLNAVKVTSAEGVPLDVQMTLEAGGFTGTLVSDGGSAEYRTPGGVLLRILGTEFFIIYDNTTGITSAGNFHGRVEVDAGGVTYGITPGFYVDIPQGGQPTAEIPIPFTLLGFNSRARELKSPVLALHELAGSLTPTSTFSMTPSFTITQTETPTWTDTITWTPTQTITPSWTRNPTKTPTRTATQTQTSTPCPQIKYLKITVNVDPIRTVSWSATGGCAPFSGTLTSKYTDQSSPYHTYQVTSRSGTVPDDPPVRCEGTFNIQYTINLKDSSGQSWWTLAISSVTFIC